ncbi:MAG: fructosamine kinase [Rhodospirillales bacterium CG15_BIG_FIL_POST_REV_8_21_14_020_66_15]|nr:MAG: fructosamine kinase [Rhodospirillales bacterium CG15_BIG_FIL_POST_REV_8_21_14_020_66_15]
MTVDRALADRLRAATGRAVTGLTPLGTGTADDRLYRAGLAGGGAAAVKVSRGGTHLGVEGRMLRLLAERSALPVPGVIACEADLLVMDFVESGGRLDRAGEQHAADMVAALHDLTADTYGLEFDTVIGGLAQANTPDTDWRRFFAERRLVAMAGQARDAGRLDGETAARVERLAGRLDRWIDAPGPPSLLHGDLWGGNVLARGGRVAAFIDPAVYYGDAEVELAFTTLFRTFSDAFYARYGERRPIRPGFFEARCALYNLYPLLVHVRLFGGSYAAQVDRTLSRFGV